MTASLELTDLAVAPSGTSNPITPRVSVQASTGDVIAVVGRNGVGKTLITRAVAGTITPDERYNLLGNVQPNNMVVGYCPQDDGLIPWLTVSGNLNVPQRVRQGWTHAKDTTQDVWKAGAFKRLDIDRLVGTSVPSLSGGEKRRVALARSLIGSPNIVIWDEPGRSLDRSYSRAAYQLLYDYVKDSNALGWVVSHDFSLAAEFADLAVVISGSDVSLLRRSASRWSSRRLASLVLS